MAMVCVTGGRECDGCSRCFRDLCKVETVVTIPKKEITDRLKAGEEISGATLETRQNLQIK